MATIFPYPIASDTSSNAERKLYDLFREKLSDEYIVVHSVRWITRDPRRYGPVGEADFVIAHAKLGILVLEVKGGGVHLDAGKWYTINAAGEKDPLDKDPIVQADKSVYALLDHLKRNEATQRYTYPIYHAVAFPDIEVSPKKSLRPDIPRTIIIDRSRLPKLQTTVEEIFSFWHERYHPNPPGESAIAALKQLLVPKQEIRTKIAHIFEDEDQQIKKLTEAQFGTLRLMQMFRRAAIIGGAGTGKTMLAIEKARQLASSGFKVLLLCYNSNLEKWLTDITSDNDLITVSTFHKLTRIASESWADLPLHQRKSGYLQKPEDALFDALETIHGVPEKVEKHLFDAVIVDEGQDFNSHYWIPIPELLKDPATGVLYVFFDDNQRIYTQLSNIPISKEQPPLILSDNCRNTKSIFGILREYTKTATDIRCVGPDGRPVEQVSASDDAEMRKALQSTLHSLIDERGAFSSQIIVLTPRKEENSLWKEGLKLGNYTLTWQLDSLNHRHIRVSTIHGFKGLESPIVILTEMKHAFSETHEQLAYIGVSRARNHLIIIGGLPNIEGVKN